MSFQRGYLLMTTGTFKSLRRYMHTMPQFGDKRLYYGTLPVVSGSTKENFRVFPNGKKLQICL